MADCPAHDPHDGPVEDFPIIVGYFEPGRWLNVNGTLYDRQNMTTAQRNELWQILSPYMERRAVDYITLVERIQRGSDEVR